MDNSEINQLKSALGSSPSNQFIRKLLVEKVIEEGGASYENEAILKDSLRMYPTESFYTESLVSYYFKQSKYSVCIAIYENYSGDRDLALDVKTKISISFLELNEIHRAKEIYFEIIESDAEFENSVLDSHFKIVEISKQQDKTNTDSEKLFVKSNIKFEDVGGLEEIKRQIEMKIIKPLQNKGLFEKYGKKTGGGILFFGPPGCGKTFIAKATAGEIESNFISVGLNNILDMYLGSSERNVHRYFSVARENNPCVLFFDEVDALGASRDSFQSSVGKGVVNQFLSEMDGVDSSNEGVLIIGATNTPWQIDNALLRPGRFGRIIFVPPPDARARELILKLKLEKKPISNLDYSAIVKKTKLFSGADLDGLIDIAIEKILEIAIKTGVERSLTTSDLVEAADQVKPSTLSWFNIAKNYVSYGNKSGIYNDVKDYLVRNNLL